MAQMTVAYYEKIKDYLHPHINQYVNHYRSGGIIDLSPYHGCNCLNRCGTRKEIEYNLCYQCVISTYKTYWKKTNTDFKTSELIFGKYDKEVYQSCRYYHQVIKVKKDFKGDPSIYNMCFKFLQNVDKINPQVHVIWTEKQKYRVFTNFHRSYVDRIFRYENIKDKYGEISQKTINIHLNFLT